MSFKPDEKDWMAYLYGELEGREKALFEEYLQQDEEARLKLMKFRQVQEALTMVEDKEVIAPPIVIGDQGKSSLWQIPYWRTIASIAASLLVVILAARFSGLQMQFRDQEFRMSFGEVQTPPKLEAEKPAQVDNGLQEHQVREMIDLALTSHSQSLEQHLRKSQEKFDVSIQRNLAANSQKIDQLMREAATATQLQVQQYVAGLQEQNMAQVKDYFQLSSTEQKKYMENLLVDFAQYLQQQRANDLQLVQMQMQNIEENTNVFKQETEQILTGIISSVNSTGSPIETRN